MFASWQENHDKPRQCAEKYRITLPTKVHIVKAVVFPVVMYGWENWTVKKAECQELMPSNCGAREDSWESLGQQGDQTNQSQGKSTLNSLEGLMLKLKLQYVSYLMWTTDSLEKLGAEGEESIRGWAGWTASPMQRTWTWANFWRWWGTRKPGMLQSMGSQRVGPETTGQLNNNSSWFTMLC